VKSILSSIAIITVILKFNRSSQHRTERGCDDDTKKAFGTGRTSETTLARPALGSAA